VGVDVRRGVGVVGAEEVEEESLGGLSVARKLLRCDPVVGMPGEGDRRGLAGVNAMGSFCCMVYVWGVD